LIVDVGTHGGFGDDVDWTTEQVFEIILEPGDGSTQFKIL
jgi:hypothetical protein